MVVFLLEAAASGVKLRRTPTERVASSGIKTAAAEYQVDILVSVVWAAITAAEHCFAGG